MRYFIHLAYNGTRFCGWQMQPHSPSVQESLNQSLSALLGEPIATTGAGRTDSGVHASDFYAHFDIEKSINCEQTCYKLNRMLPYDIVIYRIYAVTNDLHARFSATARTYTYNIVQTKNPFNQETVYFFPHKLNVDAMNEASKLLLGYQDFTSFSKLHTDVTNNFCTITQAYWQQNGDKLTFTISANRFLRNMVRSIVGTLLDVGQGKISQDDFREIIASKNRGNAGRSIPACGLSLYKIEY